MKKFLIALSIISLGIHAAEFMLEKYDLQDVSSICAIEASLKAVYLSAFEQAYNDHWTEQFEQSYVNFFDTHIEKLKHSDEMLLVVAKKNGHVAGWILFSLHENSAAIIEIICINPAFQREGYR